MRRRSLRQQLHDDGGEGGGGPCAAASICHDRDVCVAPNLPAEELSRLAGCDDRKLRVDARGTRPEAILVQVLAGEARATVSNSH